MGCRGLGHLGDLKFWQKTAQDVVHEWACCDEAASHQLPIAAAIFVILHLSTVKEHGDSTPY